MHRISICYGQPADAVAFDNYYNDIHAPLALQIPGLASSPPVSADHSRRDKPRPSTWSPASSSRLPRTSK